MVASSTHIGMRYVSIRDKDIRLVRQTDGYSIRENMVDLWIPDSVEDGIRVDYGKQSVRLLPLGGSGAARQQGNSVIYTDFYGPGMDLKYTPTLSGLKEDIVLKAYTGVNSFSFLLETGGLHLCEAGGKYYLATSQTARATFYLGDIIVFDAIGRPSEGTMTVETVTPGEAYRLTISADIDFLTDPTTVYPVTIDPTVTVTDTTSESMIEDSPVFSKYPNNNHGYGAFLYNSIGYTNATLGTGRTVFRFNGLLADPKFNSLDPDNITSVEFFVRDAGTNGNYQVNIHAILGNSTWTESTVTWNSVSNYSSTVYDSETLGYSYWSTFDITLLAKGWKNGTLNGQCGLIMVAANESQYIVTCSTDYTYDTLWPYVVMTYEDDFYLNHSVMDLARGESFTLVGIVNSAANTSLSWNSSNSSVASVSALGYVTGHIAGTATITATYTDAQGNTSERFCTVHVTMPNGVYRFDNLGSSKRMEARQGGIADGTLIAQQLNITQALHELRYYAQMWKIEYVSNGNYTIRPMHRLGSMLYYLPSNQTAIKEFTSTPSSALWKIEQVGNSYVIRASDNSKVLAPAGSSTAVNAVIQTVTYNANSTAHKWTLTTVTGLADKLLLIDHNNLRTVTNPNVYIAPNETRSLRDMGFSISFVSAQTNSQIFSWECISNDSNTISYDNQSQAVTGISGDTITELKFYMRDYGAATPVSIMVHITALPDGTYCLLNKQTEYCADFVYATLANGVNVFQSAFRDSSTQHWIFSNLGDGYYSIQTAYTPVPYYLGVEDDSNELGANIVLRTGALTDGMKWKINITESGAFSLSAKSCDVNHYVLNGNATLPEEYVELIQGLDVPSDNYADEWKILPFLHIGMSVDNYVEGCANGSRSSYLYANIFFDSLDLPSGGLQRTRDFRYNTGNPGISASPADFSVNGAISNDIEFMIYIGHGHKAHDGLGNHLHYDCGISDKEEHAHCNPATNVYTSQLEFGSSESALRWIWLYTCNALATGEYVDKDDLKAMMNGAHIVMGYSTQTTLCTPMAIRFAQYLAEGHPIIKAFFAAGYYGEASVVSAQNIQRVVFLLEAEEETIYSPFVFYGDNPSLTDVDTMDHCIHDEISLERR